MRKLLIALSAVLYSIICISQITPYDSSNLYTKKLRNGMTLIFYYTPETSNSSIYIGFNAGNRYDENGFKGRSKLLERLAFKGSAKIGSKDVAEEYRLIKEIEKLDEEIIDKHKKGDFESNDLNTLVQKALLIRNKLRELAIPNAFEKILFSLGAKYHYARTTPDFFEIGMT
ncbi:MAG: insulinase family protein, partial [Acidobacteria bacterium]|nr:insulinase family protein [Acidobacteriota bacterium]